VLISIATLFLLAVEIWSKHPMHQATRTMVMAALSFLLGAMSLLLVSAREGDGGHIRLARGAAVLGLFTLGVLIVLGASGVDISPRVPGLAAGLFVVPALSLPVLRLLENQG
jgi:peptidoglycan/LPS O-acetylase OafA/YrhL